MAHPRPTLKDLPRNLKPYFLALFAPGEHWNQTDGAEDLPARQLAYMRTQFEAGRYRVAGPIFDGGRFAAMVILEAESLQAAKDLAEQDPAVLGKRLVVEVHPALLPALDGVRALY